MCYSNCMDVLWKGNENITSAITLCLLLSYSCYTSIIFQFWCLCLLRYKIKIKPDICASLFRKGHTSGTCLFHNQALFKNSWVLAKDIKYETGFIFPEPGLTSSLVMFHYQFMKHKEYLNYSSTYFPDLKPRTKSNLAIGTQIKGIMSHSLSLCTCWFSTQ